MGRTYPNGKIPKHKISIFKDDQGWTWVYFVDGHPRASAPKHWDRLSSASRTANTFREFLANADTCKIEPPPGHKYSGD